MKHVQRSRDLQVTANPEPCAVLCFRCKKRRNRTLGIAFFLFICMICACLPTQAQEPGDQKPALEFGGFIKSLTALEFPRSLDAGFSSNLIHNRFNIVWNMTNEFSANLGIRNRIFYGEDIRLIPNYAEMIAADPGYFDFSVLWVKTPSLIIHSIADRAYLRFNNAAWDIDVGRQRINWGINTVWNPNDLFNAYNFLDFDYEERPGTDAARVEYALSTNSSIQGAFAPSKSKNGSVAAALYRFNTWHYDVQLLGGIFQADLVAGISWAGNLSDAGFKGEVSYFHPRERSALDSSDAVSASVSLDDAIGDYFVTLSALYTSAASANALDILSLSSENLSPKMLMPFRYTYYASFMRSFTPLFTASAAIIYSPTFNSLILFPTLSYSLSENTDADLIAESYFDNASGVYAADANAIFLRIRYSF